MNWLLNMRPSSAKAAQQPAEAGGALEVHAGIEIAFARRSLAGALGR